MNSDKPPENVEVALKVGTTHLEQAQATKPEASKIPKKTPTKAATKELSKEQLLTQLKQACLPVVQIAIETGIKLLKTQQTQAFEIEIKPDDSPVTSADHAASQQIVEALQTWIPSLPVYTEETNTPWQERQTWETYWLVDPLDGTQEFIYGSTDFAVSIALIHQGKPVLGVIYGPAYDTVYFASAGGGAYVLRDGKKPEPLQVRQLANPKTDPLIIALSRRQPEARILSRLELGERSIEKKHLGSCALKACWVAEGVADCFYRVGVTGEWDTAAAEVIVKEAGGSLVSATFESLSYNQTEHAQNPNFLVLGDSAIPWQSLILS